MNSLEQFFVGAGFTDGDLEKIVHSFSLKHFHKDDHFIEEGKISIHLGFIETGVFQYYFLTDGEERTTYIAAENSFLASLLSFLNGTPSREYIRALTSASVWVIKKPNLPWIMLAFAAIATTGVLQYLGYERRKASNRRS